MNVFWHELRMRRKSTLVWSIAMVIFAVMCMAKFETITTSGGAAVKEILASFPSTIQALFGMNGLDLTTVAGYFGVCFIFVGVILAIHGGLLGASLLADEEQNHTTEFLYVKPRSRAAIVTSKLLAGLVCAVGVWAATTFGFALTIKKFAPHSGFAQDFILFILAALIIQLFFLALGSLAAAIGHSASRIVPIAVFASYLLYVFAKMSAMFTWLHYGSIFSYFDARDIITTHALKLHYVALCLLAIAVWTLATLILYRRRDLHA